MIQNTKKPIPTSTSQQTVKPSQSVPAQLTKQSKPSFEPQPSKDSLDGINAALIA
jgi:hypothetical protein